jgi:uncharacterized protein (DUF849 family)
MTASTSPDRRNEPKPFVIEAAINGSVTTRAQNPSLPCTAAEVAADAAAAHAEGAAIVHFHVRDRDGVRINEHDRLLAEHVAAITAIRSGPAPLLWNTFPVGGDCVERFRLFQDLSTSPATRPDFGAHDVGSLNIVWYSEDDGAYRSTTYVNTFDDVCYFLREFKHLGLRPFLNLFEPGFVRTVRAALDLGLLDEPVLVKLYFSDRYGLPPARASVETYLDLLSGIRCEWFGCYPDGDVLPYVELFAEMDGHVRVGLEDYAYASEPVTNADLVRRAAASATRVGRPVATVEDAVRILCGP